MSPGKKRKAALPKKAGKKPSSVPDLVPGMDEFLIYQSEDGQTRIQVRFREESVWLTQQLMAELFQTTQQNISLHILNIYEEGELNQAATHKKYLSVQTEGKREIQRERDYYNLDMIISVGYRVKSGVATRFRQWATQRLREYIIKGFALDDERLKQAGGGNYFDELLARIRDIRSSEKVFWRKVLEIYATSIDYDPSAQITQEFFAVVQNKMHWAAHGHTAAEIVYQRADSERPYMGMTNWPGSKLKKSDAAIAKNYLDENELEVLNRIVSMYLDYGELQAMNRKTMYMKDWIAKLDDFINISDREILTHPGTVSHEQALEKAHEEYEKYRQAEINSPAQVEKHFLETAKKIEKLGKPKKKKNNAKK
ncbi:virulence RhuM family protein [Fibrobacterota bacterium]